MKHKTPKGKPHFRYIGKEVGDVDLTFHQKGFNVRFRNQFGSDRPDPDGTEILYCDFDRIREESKEVNPDYETTIDDKLTILQSAILERLACPISSGMRIAYSDVLALISEVKE